MARTKDFDENEVLNKAICLFWHKGYNGTSMQDLVDGLGISRSSLYDTYGDKHTLYLKALESYEQSAGSELSRILTGAKSAKEKLKQLMEWVVYNLVNDKDHKGCFMVNAKIETAGTDPDVYAVVCRSEQQVIDAFYKTIKTGQDKGELTNKQDAHTLANFMVNTVNGMRVTAKSTTDKSFFDDIISTTLKVLD
ncbi:TetR/AcrR family transcriptional regulator [Mucilaginibacter puniceus]